MAAKVLFNFAFRISSFNKFDKLLRKTLPLQLQCSHCLESTKAKDELNQQKTFLKHKFKYGAIFVGVTGFGLFLYSFKDDLKKILGFMPTIHALDIGGDSLRKRFNFIADVVEKSSNAVVHIESVSKGSSFHSRSRGCGFIVEEDGLIITNAHVVVNKPNCVVQVKLKDGRFFKGFVEDVDLRWDLATVRIQAKNLPVVKLGSSVDLRAGEWVVAIGSPLSLTDSVSAGVVSSPERKGSHFGPNDKDMTYIQTDAAVTFGNSGGPLVNLDGEVIGVNSIKITSGISFAIPIEYVKMFLKRNKTKREQNEESVEKKGYLGISMISLTKELVYELNHRNLQIPEFLINGILVVMVMVDSPAFRSGLKTGDIIAEINGKPVEGVKSAFKAADPAKTMIMKVYRGNLPLHIALTPERIPNKNE